MTKKLENVRLQISNGVQVPSGDKRVISRFKYIFLKKENPNAAVFPQIIIPKVPVCQLQEKIDLVTCIRLYHSINL